RSGAPSSTGGHRIPGIQSKPYTTNLSIYELVDTAAAEGSSGSGNLFGLMEVFTEFKLTLTQVF
ncbi:hypothetical protein L9F63_027514, partial [Diploptera punctata]